MNYRNAFPYFPENDIENILSDIRKILSGDGLLSKGPKVKEFESKFAAYTGSKYAVSTNSCTTALEIVLRAIQITASDEVIVPTQTFMATGSSVIITGGKVVFCESDENFLLDFADLKKKVSDATKAVIIVHYAGLIHPEIDAIKQFLKERNIYLIEDCAHSSGASINSTFAGNIGDFGCHSFFSTKIMTTGEGGMITTNSDEFYHICSSLRSIGIDTYSGKEVFTHIGSNNRMAEIESILGLSQLNRLDEFVNHRIDIASIYKNELREFEENGSIWFQKFPDTIRHPYWKFVIFLNTDKYSRDTIKQQLAERGINAEAPYQPLMHLQPVFRRISETKEGDLPKSEAMSNTHICLPIHVKITQSDARKISHELKQVLSK